MTQPTADLQLYPKGASFPRRSVLSGAIHTTMQFFIAVFMATCVYASSPVVRHEFRDPSGTASQMYVANADTGDKVLLLIQGSGCEPIFPGNQTSSNTLFGLSDAIRDPRFAVIAVEKPHHAATRTPTIGVAENCSRDFKEYFTLQRWVQTLRAALDAYFSRYRMRDVVVIAFSEGSDVAARLAREDRRITKLALFAGAGTGQLFELYGDVIGAVLSGESEQSAIASLDNAMEMIRRDPESIDRMYRGHPFRRWTSFLNSMPDDDLIASQAAVYIVTGLEDSPGRVYSSEVLYTKLKVAQREVVIRRIEGVGHSIVLAGNSALEPLRSELRLARDWLAASG